MRNLLLLFLFLSAYCNSTISAQNLLTNGDMEDWSQTDGVYSVVPEGYHRGTSTADNIARAEGRGGTGNALWLINNTAVVNNHKRFSSPKATLQPGEYEFSFFVKGIGSLRWLRMSNSIDNPTSTNNYLGKELDINEDDWTEIKAKIEIQTAGTYYFHFSFYKTSEEKPFLMDDITLKAPKAVEANDPTLKSIAIGDHLDPSAKDYVLFGFDPQKEDYITYLWFGTDTVPDLKITPNNSSATYEIMNDNSNQFLAGENKKAVRIVVTSEDETAQKTYTVTFDRSNYVYGFLYNTSVSSNVGLSSITNLYRRSEMSHGLHWGSYAMRPLSTNENAYIETVPLINGAGTLSFWSGAYDGTFIENAPVYITAYYKADESSEWIQLGNKERVDNLNNTWTEFIREINCDSPTTRVKLEYTKDPGATYNFSQILIDDLFISPFKGSSSTKDKLNPGLSKVYTNEQSIVIEGQTPYAVYSVSGQIIASGHAAERQVISLQKGFYLVNTKDGSQKIILK